MHTLDFPGIGRVRLPLVGHSLILVKVPPPWCAVPISVISVAFSGSVSGIVDVPKMPPPWGVG